jgi:hypothetical protein
MKTSLTTFEHDLRECLLDIIHSQWADLGVPFTVSSRSRSTEVIDPESLLWCSLEFLPTEPRLREGVVSWLRANHVYIIRQRVNRLARKDESRALIWNILTTALPWRGVTRSREDADRSLAGRPTKGASTAEPKDFGQSLRLELSSLPPDAGRAAGKPASGPSTILIRSRDILGSDLRHVLLVYLLANPHGAKLSAIAQWSGYVYRGLLETATRWQTAGILTVEHGHYRLVNTRPWVALLDHDAEQAVIVDWLQVFDASIQLLRALAKGVGKGFSADSPVVGSFVGKLKESLSRAVLSESPGPSPSVTTLRRLLDQHGT